MFSFSFQNVHFTTFFDALFLCKNIKNSMTFSEILNPQFQERYEYSKASTTGF